jgi:hypothetical protein
LSRNLPEIEHEIHQNARDAARQLREEWDNRLILGVTDLRERYKNGRLSLHLHLSCAGLETGQFCAFFDRPGPNGDWCALFDMDAPIHKIQLNIPATDNGSSYEQQPMFVGIVEIRQNPEGIVLEIVPSMKRLQRLDECLGVTGDALYYGFSSGFITIPRPGNRKLGFLCGRGRTSCCADDQLVNRVIQGRPKLVENFSDDEAEAGRDGLNVGKPENQFSGIGVVFLNDFLGVVATKNFKIPLECIEVLFGPFNLGNTAI